MDEVQKWWEPAAEEVVELLCAASSLWSLDRRSRAYRSSWRSVHRRLALSFALLVLLFILWTPEVSSYGFHW